MLIYCASLFLADELKPGLRRAQLDQNYHTVTVLRHIPMTHKIVRLSQGFSLCTKQNLQQ